MQHASCKLVGCRLSGGLAYQAPVDRGETEGTFEILDSGDSGWFT